MKEAGKLFWGQDAGGASMGAACVILQESEVTDCRVLPRGSNDVFLLSLRWDGQTIPAIYKPRRGEYPLWDFPGGTLYRREYAAYLVSEALEWSLIPPTVIPAPSGFTSSLASCPLRSAASRPALIATGTRGAGRQRGPRGGRRGGNRGTSAGTTVGATTEAGPHVDRAACSWRDLAFSGARPGKSPGFCRRNLDAFR